jgi:hypothetical protein
MRSTKRRSGLKRERTSPPVRPPISKLLYAVWVGDEGWRRRCVFPGSRDNAIRNDLQSRDPRVQAAALPSYPERDGVHRPTGPQANATRRSRSTTLVPAGCVRTSRVPDARRSGRLAPRRSCRGQSTASVAGGVEAPTVAFPQKPGRGSLARCIGPIDPTLKSEIDARIRDDRRVGWNRSRNAHDRSPVTVGVSSRRLECECRRAHSLPHWDCGPFAGVPRHSVPACWGGPVGGARTPERRR